MIVRKYVHLQEIKTSVSIGTLDTNLVAPCPGGRTMSLHLNRPLEKSNLCAHKALVSTYFYEDLGRFTLGILT